MHKHIRPANEEFHGVSYALFFCFVWYGNMIKAIVAYGFETSYLLLIVGGLIPLTVIIQSVRQALYYRQKRQEAINYNDHCPGIITKVTQEYKPDTDSHNHSINRGFYFLYVDMYLNNGTIYTIKSEAYRKPIYKYLASNRINVYTDESGWHYYLEDFVYREHKDDSYGFSFDEEHHYLYEYIKKIIIFLIYLVFIYEVLFVPF